MREICGYAGEKRALWAQDTMCIRDQKVGAGPACERGNKEPGVIGARGEKGSGRGPGPICRVRPNYQGFNCHSK